MANHSRVVSVSISHPEDVEAQFLKNHVVNFSSVGVGRQPAYLKSNNDKSNGGTLKYTVTDGKVEFDYAGFASWWNASLDNYNANGIYPKYISIQNEPDWDAPYESCLMRPSETVNATDTLAGYNKALDAVYEVVLSFYLQKSYVIFIFNHPHPAYRTPGRMTPVRLESSGRASFQS